MCHKLLNGLVKDTEYVCGSCGTPLCGVDKGVPQLPQTNIESFDY